MNANVLPVPKVETTSMNVYACDACGSQNVAHRNAEQIIQIVSDPDFPTGKRPISPQGWSLTVECHDCGHTNHVTGLETFPASPPEP
jgi:uncharacterized Zn finger protein